MHNFLDSDNRTAQRVWHANPTTRGTWDIYQSCIITIGLCVWQAVHMNMAPPGEASYKQTLRKAAWVMLALAAPELVAINAWHQLREAMRIRKAVNKAIAGLPGSQQSKQQAKSDTRGDLVHREERPTNLGKEEEDIGVEPAPRRE